MRNHLYSTLPPVKKSPMPWLFPVLFLLASLQPKAQNLNNPNKPGPLGTYVNALTGNFFVPRTDAVIPARGFDMAIRFSYNSFLLHENYGYGKGWTFQYDIRYKTDTTPGRKIVMWGDGREDKYDSLPGGLYKIPQGFFSRLQQYSTGKFRLTEPDSVTYFFDDPSHKKITRMQEPNGNYIQFNYAGGLLASLINNAGQTITFTYDGTGKLTTIVDAVASPTRTFTYKYDPSGNLTEVKDPLGATCKYTYLVNGPMKTLADKNNNKIDIIYFPNFRAREVIGCNKRLGFSYDTTQKKTVITDYLQGGANQVTTYTYRKLENLSWITSVSGNCCGFNMKYEYDDQGNRIVETNANGNVFNYTFDGTGNLLTATDPMGGKNVYTYSTNFNKITSYKDANGNRYTMEYDSKGNLIKLTAPGNNNYLAAYNGTGDIISSTDPKGNVFTYHYDAYGNPVNVSGPDNYSALLSFDARGNLLSHADAGGHNYTAEYDILSRLKKVTDPLNHSMQYGYDAAGNIVSVKNKNNETTAVNYDASNRPVKVTGPTGSTMEIGYDEMDKVIRVKDPLFYQTQFSYDTRSRLSSVKDALGNSSHLAYDGNGNVISATGANGRTLNYTYDKLNRLTKVADGTGDIAAFTHDAAGNVISYKNGTGSIITAQYDSLNRVKKIVDALSNSTTCSYDKNSRVIAITDRNGFTRQYTYDGMNRVKTFTDNNGFVVTISYDAEGNITQLTDQKGAVTTYTYDELNRRKKMTYPDGTFEQYTYDKKGNPVTRRLTDGTTINYSYDTLNRLTTKTLPSGGAYTYAYDKLGRVVAAGNAAGTVSISYDALGRIASETYDGRTVNYRYNTAGRTQTTVYPDGGTVIKEFDTRNRLSRILKDSVLVSEYAYNNANQLTNKLFANGVQTVLQYDIANRLNSLTTAGGSIQQLTYAYDKEGNKTAVNRLNNSSLSETFGYDNGYRLLTHKRGAIENTYAYDAVGNRTTASINGVNITYTVNNLNQLTAKNGVGFTYDGRGNLIYDGRFYKTYDSEGRLMKDSSSPASVLTYTYDALGRRTVKAINGNAFKYTYSGAAQIEERNSANTLLTRTVFTNFLSPVVNEKNGNSFYYHQNEMMSVDAITAGSGRLLETYRYNTYGAMQRYDSLNNPLATSLAGNRVGFTGQEWDSATGSYRFFFRNYSPETGVFNQRDLIEYADGMGMYQYVGNNPANGIDVWGLAGQYESMCPNPADLERTYKDGGGLDMLQVKLVNDIGSNTSMVGDLIETTGKGFKGFAEGFSKKAGPVMAATDVSIKGKTAYDAFTGGEASGFEQIDASFDLVASGANAVGGSLPGAVIGGIDAAVEGTTGKNIRQHTEVPMTDHAKYLNEKEGFESWAAEHGLITEIFDFQYRQPQMKIQEYMFLKNLWLRDKGPTYLKWRMMKVPGGSCQPPGGTLNPPPGGGEGGDNGSTTWTQPIDPNEIIGPDGVSNKKWVSVKDRMNYTIRCENDTAASAPARYIRFNTTLHSKHDPATFQLSGFGFNNQTFEIPQGLSSYYQRFDCRDSMGLYLDVVAGFDPVAGEAFWEFRGIDPLTLLPSEDPEKGILFLQDTAQPLYGHGYVTFSIKPKTTAVTLDTTAAIASIVFDENQAIQTNVWVNTIDAVAPTSALLAGLPGSTTAVLIPVQYSAADDANGSGFKAADLYVSLNAAQPVLWITAFTGGDTSFVGLKGNTYTFFASATDKVNNREELKNIGSTTVRLGDCIGSNFVFTANSSGASYQWQVNDGSGFTNLSNNVNYEGATSQTLVVKTTAGPMAGYQYRCNVAGTFSATDTLRFINYWQGTVSTAWEDAANWSCSAVPNEYTDVVIEGDRPQYPVVNSNPTIRSLKTNSGSSVTVRTGYNITIVK